MRQALASVFAGLLATTMLSACGAARVTRAPGARPAAAHPVRVSVPRYGASAVVRRGETLYHIATDNGISALDLAMWNQVPPPYTIYPGQRLRLYPAQRTTRPGDARRRASTARAAPATGIPAQVAADAAATPADSPFRWSWPADGRIATPYAAGDPTRQGIDISGQGGQPVRAAADGVVVYSGSGLVGYGELIIVKHDDAWLSAYGHNRARLVSEGQRVTAGQQIAEMGRSGAASDVLHFEIRYNGKPVDPLRYLPQK